MNRKSLLRLASRFAHLALGAKAEDEDEEDKEASAKEESESDDEDEKDEAPKKEEKKGKKAKRAESDDESDDADAAESDEDEKCKAAASTARASERERWAAVLGASEAKGRVPLACSLLADTDMPAEKIRSALMASPAESRQGGLSARMSAVPRPDVGSAPSSGAPDPRSPAGQASAIVTAYKKAFGG